MTSSLKTQVGCSVGAVSVPEPSGKMDNATPIARECAVEADVPSLCQQPEISRVYG